MFNAYCFLMATVVAQMCLSVTLYIHCLSFWLLCLLCFQLLDK